MTKLFIAAAAVALLASPANAADKKHHGPCFDDVQKFCKDVEHGKGRIIACLNEHSKELSEGCTAARTHHNTHIADKIQEACHDDVSKFCHDTKPGKGRILRCLKKHHGDLHDECKTLVESGKHRKGAHAAAHEKGGEHHEAAPAEHHEGGSGSE